MKQEQIIDILNNSQKEFKGINEANLDSADILKALFEKQKLEFAIRELMWVNILIPFEHQYAKDCIDNKIKELEQKLSEL